jgi:23S rRNA pseudouridine2604 synthase
MTTLKLKARGSAHDQREPGRRPVRGGGPRRRLTLAEAQAERAARAPTAAQGQQASKPPARERRVTGRGERTPARQGAAPRRREEQLPKTKPAAQPVAQRRPKSPPRATPSAQPPRERPAPITPAAPATASDGIRLSKRLTELGLASRREADEWIEAGRVRVNGRLAVLGQRVGPHDRIDIDPQARRDQASKLTVLLHKPIGYVSGQAEGRHRPATALMTAANRWHGDRLPVRIPPSGLHGLAPAGRLDIDSTGLLVLTQDGRIAKRLIGHEAAVEKEYLVRVRRRGPLRAVALDLLRHGLELDGVKLRPAKVSWQNEEQLRFVLREGRKRQIRRMCELVGLEVIGLKRVRIGSVVLGGLPVGQWRLLRPQESF